MTTPDPAFSPANHHWDTLDILQTRKTTIDDQIIYQNGETRAKALDIVRAIKHNGGYRDRSTHPVHIFTPFS
jgi:hypothetical protein